MLLGLALAFAATAQAAQLDIQDRIRFAQDEILPKAVYIFVVGRDYAGGESQRALWSGSGVIISTDGFVATNHHVLSQAQRVRVLLSDRREYEATVVGTDEETDLGLLRLNLPKDHPPLPSARFGDSSALRTGDFVLAVGSPLGLTRTVSLGVVNNPAQSLSGDDLYNWIQTDAAINPGNSGGPLVDLGGRVVGINTLGAHGTGLGFAIPSGVAWEVLARLRESGRVERGVIGVSLQALRDFERDSRVPGERGVLVAGVSPESPAAAAGFLPGDLLLSAGGAPTDALYPEDMPAVRRTLAALKPGAPARFAVLRQGRELTLTATPKPRETAGPESGTFAADEWMMTVRESNENDDGIEHYLRPKGCYVLGAIRNGNAARSGLRPMDIMLEIEGAEINSLEDFRRSYERSLARRPPKRLILVSVLRGGRPLWIALDYNESRASYEEGR